MTDRLADLTARIDGIDQLGAVVNAMRGIAGARAQQARGQLGAVETYSAMLADAIGRALALSPDADAGRHTGSRGSAIVLFCAEQGFVGAFSERILGLLGTSLAATEIFMIGSRGAEIAAERGIEPVWKSAMPSHSLGIPKLADHIAEALYARIAAGEIDQLDAIFAQRHGEMGIRIERRRLFPLDMTRFPRPSSNPPLLNLPPSMLLRELAADYLHAQLCDAALHAFAAENEARMEAMASARHEIERQLAALQATQRIVRQDEITSEIIELATGEAAGRGVP
ncbi:MAG TPA: FoF1 ATP synthase subunit gamma [Aliidongia sp.]|nr:FoF1 ATP synthase subunit gamma [Aliidongia sp.]